MKFSSIILLAGGQSSRFSPLSDKNLFLFQGKSLLELQIRKYLPYTENLFVVANQENFSSYELVIRKIKSSKIKIVIQKGKGQGAGIMACLRLVKKNVLILNNNDLFEEKKVFSIYGQKKDQYPVILSGRFMKEYFPGGYFKLNGKEVLGVVEKPDPDKKPSDYYKLVIDYFRDPSSFYTFLIMFSKQKRDDIYELALDQYLKNNRAYFVDYNGIWLTLKYPWQVLAMMDYFLMQIKKTQIAKKVLIAKSAVIEGPVILEEGVKILEFAKVVGPTYIGKNTIIGNYSLVRQSMIGNDCLIGGYSEVTRSYLGQKVMLHRNYLGDSVVENDVLFGAGATCANFRFDQDEIKSLVKGSLINTKRQKLGAIIGSGTKIGINASLMPGVKIGSKVFVYPGEVVKWDRMGEGRR